MEKVMALPRNIRQIGDIRGRERIYLEDYVMTYIRKKENTEGYLGVILGERQEAEDQDCFFIRGILEIPEQQEEQELSDWKDKIEENCRAHFPDWKIQGCCVIGTYPTKQMDQLAEVFPESMALLYHLQEQEESLYIRKDGQYRRIKGYFVFYEQNKKMQEYLSEVFQANSVEKEGVSDKAIRSFREKVKEKGQQKSSSMMKLAGSFFVVGMLAIAAITVNRVEDIRSVQNMDADFTEENEAVSGRVQEETEEETRLINGALMQEQSERVSEETISWQAGSRLKGPESFWEVSEQETEQMQTMADTSDMEVTEPVTDIQETEVAQEAAAMRQIQASYVIRQGDTLAEICKRYYGSMEQLNSLCEANGITDANVIMPGQKIILP